MENRGHILITFISVMVICGITAHNADLITVLDAIHPFVTLIMQIALGLVIIGSGVLFLIYVDAY